jgi:hypothetical protein
VPVNIGRTAGHQLGRIDSEVARQDVELIELERDAASEPPRDLPWGQLQQDGQVLLLEAALGGVRAGPRRRRER